MKHTTTKRALLLSVLSMLLCCAMLVGSTFAWFTDSVTSAGNKIVAGNLKVDLIHVGGGEEGADVSIKENPDHLIFNYDKWEPGYTTVETLRVENKGNLAFKFRLDAVAAGATDGPNGEKLADVIDVYVYEGSDLTGTTSFADMTEANGWRNAGSLSALMADSDGMAHGVLLPTGAEPKKDEPVGFVQMTVALHMQESAGNAYQGLTLGDLNFNLRAAQYTYEEDSFGKDYDKKAAYPGDIENADQLKNALNNPEVKKVNVVNDITTTMRISSDKEINLNDNVVDQYGNAVIVNKGADVTIKNGTIKDVGSSKAVDIEFGSQVTFENVKFEMTTDRLINNSAPAYTAVGVRASVDAKTTVTFKNCTFENQGVEFGGMNGASEIDVKFENCTFNAVSKVEGDKSFSNLSKLISLDSNYLCGNVEIIGCTFTYSGFLSDTNWKAYAISASGCKVDAGKTLTLTLKDNTFNLSDAAAGNALSATEHAGLVVVKDF